MAKTYTAEIFGSNWSQGPIAKFPTITAASVGVLYVNANRKATDIMDDASAAYKIATKRAAEKAGEAVAVELIRIVYPSR